MAPEFNAEDMPTYSAALATPGLIPVDIAARIAAADGREQSGRLQRTRTDLSIAIPGEIEALDRLREIVVRGSAHRAAQGGIPAVPLSDCAVPKLEPAQSVITRRNGARTIIVQGDLLTEIWPEEALRAALDEAGCPAAGLQDGAGWRHRCHARVHGRIAVPRSLEDDHHLWRLSALILAGGSFGPSFALAYAGEVALSVVV